MPKCRVDTSWRSQFRYPRGWLGWLVGQLMAVKNEPRSLWVLSQLKLRPSDRVLEIGFGPGADIRRVAARLPAGSVMGIDHSETMVRQAARRNARAIDAGCVSLRQGEACELPYESDFFDAVYSINVAQFWDEPALVAREIRRVLKPGAQVALAVQPRSKGATEQTARETGCILVEALKAAGFSQVRLEQKQLAPVSVVCALSVK
jgi:ubiquinone/menaquinone biosynthesis C-methylase UbiE